MGQFYLIAEEWDFKSGVTQDGTIRGGLQGLPRPLTGMKECAILATEPDEAVSNLITEER